MNTERTNHVAVTRDLGHRRLVARTSLLPATLVLGAVITGEPAVSTTPRSSELILTEIAHTALPSDVPLAGGYVADNGAFVFWRADASSVLLVRSGTTGILCGHVLRRPVGGAFIQGDSVAEIVDSVTSAVHGVTVRGACTLRRRFATLAPIVAAKRVPGRWVLATIDSAFQSALYVAPDGSDPYRVPLPDRVGSIALDWNKFHLTADSSAIILAMHQWPFTWTRVALGAPEALPVQGTNPSATLEHRDDSTHARTWVGLPVFPLDSGFLRVMADPASDQRLLVRYDAHGRAVRWSPLEVAFGILSTNVAKRELLAVRHVNATEIVRYRWEWSP